ncbi:hypothetical protein G7W60_23220 [Pseudomonas fluorescens]|uniref:hypothetical protein n=1 Tax=Pseudomonas TaxID=286 RepID=UPI001404B7A2|nr:MULTISPECIES: hypothetical protein [Pseudomonas]MDT8907885.1 hypothetical protein [Pseudomonas prosekii]NHN70755.1 hypothetical protein [Pseudomonas fluorescens]
MSHYIPLQTNNPECPVLLIDSQMPTAMLVDSALIRIRAGTDLLESITSVTIKGIDDGDLYRFTNAAYLLLREGSDLLEVVSRNVDGTGRVEL